MDSTKLREWLVTEKKMNIRSARDVASRYARVCRMLEVDKIDSDSLSSLQKNAQFLESSMYVKSQLKRAVVLSLEFMDAMKGI